MPIQSRDEIASTRRELEIELSKHCRIIVDIKIRLNTLVPVARLPDEILLVALQHYRRLGGDAAPRNSVWWIIISSVCHRWREIAMETPSLWADITFTSNHRRVMHMLTRSKDVPLDVRTGFRILRRAQSWHARLEAIDSTGNISDDAASIKALAKALGRARSADLSLHRDIYNFMAGSVPPAATYLQKVTFQNPSYDHLVFPTVLDDCDMPSLKDVSITSYRVNWSSRLFAPTLTHLKINYGQHANLTCTYTEILNALANIPLLMSLVLIGCMPLQSLELLQKDRAEEVTLSRLEFFLLQGYLFPCLSLFDNFTLPSSVRISFTLRLQPPEESVRLSDIQSCLQRFSHSIASKLSPNPATGVEHPTLFRILKTAWDPTVNGLHLSLWRHADRVQDLHHDYWRLPLDSADVHVVLQPALDSIESIMQSFVPGLPLQGVEVLSVQGGPFLGKSRPKSSWETLLAMLPNVSTMRINGRNGPEDCINILSISHSLESQLASHTFPDDGGKPNRHLPYVYLLPRLKTILLDGPSFRPPTKEMEDDEFLEGLISFLTARKNADKGLGVSEVILERCINMGKRDVLRLESVVKVVWDGVEDRERVPVKKVKKKKKSAP